MVVVSQPVCPLICVPYTYTYVSVWGWREKHQRHVQLRGVAAPTLKVTQPFRGRGRSVGGAVCGGWDSRAAELVRPSVTKGKAEAVVCGAL